MGVTVYRERNLSNDFQEAFSVFQRKTIRGSVFSGRIKVGKLSMYGNIEDAAKDKSEGTSLLEE
jgi:hypothetical protein